MKATGITKPEVLVIVALMILLGSILAVWLAKPKHRLSEMSCPAKLGRVGVAFSGYANEHGGSFPMALSTNAGGTREYADVGRDAYKHFQVFSNVMVLCEFLVCPQDSRTVAINWASMSNSNVSYFVGIDANSRRPDSILAGDRNVTTSSSSVVRLESCQSWIETIGLHGSNGYVLFADGHAEKLSSAGLSNVIERAGSLTNRVAVP